MSTKKYLLFIILLISNLCFSQEKSILNSKTKERIPYVNIWVENENRGTTSNINGKYQLDIGNNKIVIFSAIGFETKKIISDSIKDILELTPIITQLEEIVIKSKKGTRKLKIGKFKKSKINNYFACSNAPWISARFFNYSKSYKPTPFLEKIRVLTYSDIDNAKFNIRLYAINENGKPGDYIYDENIIGTARKGKKITEVDISNLNITFPKEGFFIAIEWLIIDSNEYEEDIKVQGFGKSLKRISYEPSIGTVPAETDENSWVYFRGKWQKIFKNSYSRTSKSYKNKYNLIAVELTLTN